MGHEPTDRPWEKVAVDICNLDNKDYRISVDYFSSLWELTGSEIPKHPHVSES